MKHTLSLLTFLLCSAYCFAQLGPPQPTLVNSTGSQKTNSPTDGYSWQQSYLWNIYTQVWDTVERQEFNWIGNQISNGVRFRYDFPSHSFLPKDSTSNIYTGGRTESDTYTWDGSSYFLKYFTEMELDSMGNQTFLLFASLNTSGWDTMIHTVSQYYYSGNANYDSLLVTDLTQPVGMQKGYFERRTWNSAGTEPDSSFLYYYPTNTTRALVNFNYDYQWDDFANNRVHQFTLEWDSIYGYENQRRTTIWSPPGFQEMYVEIYNSNTSQFDSVLWQHQQFDAQNCPTDFMEYGYSNSNWDLQKHDFITYIYDSNNRVIVKEVSSLDPFGTLVPDRRDEYGYPLVGTPEPELPNFQATVYPNPGSGPIKLQLELETASDMEFTIWDIQGRKLFAKSWKQAPGKTYRKFNTDLAPGTYTYRLQAETGAKAGTIIRQ